MGLKAAFEYGDEISQFQNEGWKTKMSKGKGFKGCVNRATRWFGKSLIGSLFTPRSKPGLQGPVLQEMLGLHGVKKFRLGAVAFSFFFGFYFITVFCLY